MKHPNISSLEREYAQKNLLPEHKAQCSEGHFVNASLRRIS